MLQAECNVWLALAGDAAEAAGRSCGQQWRATALLQEGGMAGARYCRSARTREWYHRPPGTFVQLELDLRQGGIVTGQGAQLKVVALTLWHRLRCIPSRRRAAAGLGVAAAGLPAALPPLLLQLPPLPHHRQHCRRLYLELIKRLAGATLCTTLAAFLSKEFDFYSRTLAGALVGCNGRGGRECVCSVKWMSGVQVDRRVPTAPDVQR